MFVQQALYRNAAQQYEIAVSAVSVSVGNSVSVQTATEEALHALVNVNTADVAELCSLSGIGEAKANAIIDYRINNGPFTYKEELMKVSGIGEKLYAKIAQQIVLDDSEITTHNEDPSYVG
ncbi:MAG: helix-hairpin-helix domain-containing protein [Clostridia bacterium]|nr:helix-hairpin-helix domain-containing protein [Clostridia bacterium]